MATLAACSTDLPRASSGSSASDTTSNSDTRGMVITPDSSAAAVAAPHADSALLTMDGWGPLRMGMSRAEVVAAAGEDAQPAAVGGPDPQRCDEFHPTNAPTGMMVMIESGVLTRISLRRNAEIKTAEGIGIGSSASRVLEAYGSRARIERHQYWEDPARYITVWLDGPSGADRRGIRFEIDRAGKVVQVHAGAQSIAYVEGCL